MIMYGHPCIYKLNSTDKKTQFFKKKVTVKGTFLGIRMHSTGLLLWRNQKASTRYPIILYKRDSTTDIFNEYSNFFPTNCFAKLFQTTNYKGFLFA